MSNQEAITGTDQRTDPLIAVFDGQGLTLEPVTESAQLTGPLSAVTFKAAGDPNASPTVAVTVMSDGELDSLDQTVAAVLAAHPELEQAATLSVATDMEVVDSLPEPRELFAIVRVAQPIGLLARHNDRRSGGAAPAMQGAAALGAAGVSPGLGLLQDIVLEVSVELGRSSMPLAQLMNLAVGSLVELDRAAGSPVDVRVNGMLFARGEVVALDDEYAVRIIEILGSLRQ